MGLLAEDVKRLIQRSHQIREARRRVYDDLGAYLGRVEALSLLNGLELLLWHEVITPQTPNFDYYSAHEPGVLLRADTNRAFYKLVERLRGLGTAYRDRNPLLATGRTDDSLPGAFLVSIARSNPTAFQAVRFQRPVPHPDNGEDDGIRTKRARGPRFEVSPDLVYEISLQDTDRKDGRACARSDKTDMPGA